MGFLVPLLTTESCAGAGAQKWYVCTFQQLDSALGMTYADSDLIQIQENVIARTIASLDFSVR